MTTPHPPIPGQRWVSETEPELGLGVILSSGGGRVEILFAAAGERRVYALASAPLRRVAFKVGDLLRDDAGGEMKVEEVIEREGTLVYRGREREITEGELSDTISFSSPEDRLLAGSLDPLPLFELRAEALEIMSRIRGSAVRGYVGARVDLIPHQLSIAGEVASRLAPRVLLADEVGLGKTIEAGLILHRLHRTGRAERVLILVPEPLVHQWFVELHRRFNLPFNIYDEERCQAIEESEPGSNPFLEGQLILCSVGLLAEHPERARQAIDAGWDLLIVDEAHHLEWHPDRASLPYQIVSLLAARTPGLLLLTATPQQLGPEGHFARLHLLDPERYASLEQFLVETAAYERVAAIIDRVEAGNALDSDEIAFIEGHSPRIATLAATLERDDAKGRSDVIEQLLDSFGTGRVMFRNTRKAIEGFPERRPHLTRIEPGEGMQGKVRWLAGLLRSLGDEKVLVICRSRAVAEEIGERLRQEITLPTTLFHEELSLVQRDRNAAWFADPEGARLMISSEIGSEGRNFQFAHHLVLFDLPEDPELLEQRIGRLDRIGQTGTVHIHIPWIAGSREEVLARWYDEGLDAFAHNLHGASEIAGAVADQLAPLLDTYDESGLERLIDSSRTERERVTTRLQHGYDRLLQLNSNRPGLAEEISFGIREADADRSFERFVVRLLEHYGVRVSEIAPRTYRLREGHLLTDAFPALPPDGLAVTFDRRRALTRDDLAFFTQDHPFVRDILDLFLGSEQGNAAFATWPDAEDDGLVVEMIAVAEALAPASLAVERFFPPRPIRVAVDHRLDERIDELAAARLRGGDPSHLLEREMIRRELIPKLIDGALAVASDRMRGLVRDAEEVMTSRLSREIERLRDLSELNANVGDEEIARLAEHLDQLRRAIGAARLRVEGVRLVEM